MIEFFIAGNPQALKRHRTYRRGNINIQVDPSADAKQSFLACAMQYRPERPYDKPIMVTMEFRFQRPKSHYGAKGLKTTAPALHTSRPDVSNLVKFCEDALNGIYYRDDSIIACLIAKKRYADVAGIAITIMELST